MKKERIKSIQVYEDTFWDKIINLPEKEFKMILKKLNKIWGIKNNKN